MRRWINNDTECRIEEDADNGFEVEIVDAKDYDSDLESAQEEILRLTLAMKHIAVVASGELQVADDDTGGMKYIFDYVTEWEHTIRWRDARRRWLVRCWRPANGRDHLRPGKDDEH